MSISKATSMEDVIARLEYISKRLEEFESPEDFALSMSIDECIDYLRKNTKSSWHTEEPTEEGEYLVWVNFNNGEANSMIYTWRNKCWYLNYPSFEITNDKVIAWQNIEPYNPLVS